MNKLVLLLLPIALIELGLVIWWLYDLTWLERRVEGGNKLVGVLNIVLIGTLGPARLTGRRAGQE